MFQARKFLFIGLIFALLAGCTATPTPTEVPTVAPTKVVPTQPPVDTPVVIPTNTRPPATPTPAFTATPAYPTEGYGLTGFPEGINPLTGLEIEASMLNRRPVLIKVQNLPRSDRPQFGLSLADIVFEYYTEYGSTRFAALFYGKDAEKVMPIRSARFSDVNFIRMYKPIFIFGSAYETIYARLVNSEFYRQLVIENPNSCPAVCRVEPNGRNFISANTAELQKYLAANGIDNSRQSLDGMYFNLIPPAGSDPAAQVFVRYSGAIYNRWDYDPATGKYLRFVDTKDDVDNNNPVYGQLMDALNSQPVAAENVVVMFVRHTEVDPRPEVEVLDFSILGTGPAYIARDGQIYKVQWKRNTENDVLSLINENGQPFPFKPGQTWFEIIALNSTTKQEDNAWQFRFVSDW